MLRYILATGLTILTGSMTFAQSSEDWTPINLAVSDYHVIPRYAAFAEQGEALKAAAEGFCTSLDQDTFAQMRVSYHDAMDAWQGISHVQFGPITYFNWNYRLQFWPDDNGTGARQLNALLAEQDYSVLTAESFARASVGVQGFPALERLLFEENSLDLLQAEDFRCQLVSTIANNIGTIAMDVHQRWVDEFRTTVENADERGFFESAEDATIDYLKALIETMPRLRDQKLASPLGESFAASRVRRAESWRSERSLRNVKINLASLEEMFGRAETSSDIRLNQVFIEVDIALVHQRFDALRPTLEAVPDSLGEAFSSEAGYARVDTLRQETDALYEAIEQALKNTDLYLGFNSLDGD